MPITCCQSEGRLNLNEITVTINDSVSSVHSSYVYGHTCVCYYTSQMREIAPTKYNIHYGKLMIMRTVAIMFL